VTVATIDISAAAGIAMYPMLSLYTATGTTNFGASEFFATIPTGATGFTE
jgi:hypothetical protein